MGADGEQIGIKPLPEALAIARQQDLDLVEVADKANPPVCRIMDYGKYKYRESKKRHEAKLKQKQIIVKEVKFRPGTDEGDYKIKLRNLIRFLEEGDKTKVTLRFRGRELAHQEFGIRLLERVRGGEEMEEEPFVAVVRGAVDDLDEVVGLEEVRLGGGAVRLRQAGDEEWTMASVDEAIDGMTGEARLRGEVLGGEHADGLAVIAGLVVSTPLLAAVLLRVRINAMTWVAVGLAMAGIAVLTLNPSGLAFGYGESLTLIAAIMYALHIVGLGAWSRADDAIGMSILQILVITGICTIAALPGGGPGQARPRRPDARRSRTDESSPGRDGPACEPCRHTRLCRPTCRAG